MLLTVIAGKKDRDLYTTVFRGEEIVFYSLNDPAVSIIKNRHAEVLLMDCGFNMDKAVELLKLLKLLMPNIPIIFITDAGSEDLVIKTLKIGIRDYFKKPFEIFELRERVYDICKIKRECREKRRPLLMKENNGGAPLSITMDIPENLLRVMFWIEENLAEMIKLERLAKEANLSKYHFCRAFQKAFGVSPKRYINLRRIERAKVLLGRKDCRITDVAEKVGFNDHSTFSRHFRKNTGNSPHDYKVMLRQVR